MRILHFRGHAHKLVHAERKIGIDNFVVDFSLHMYGVKVDFVYGRFKRVRYLSHLFLKWIRKFDVLVYHAGPMRTFRFYIDWRFLRALKKPTLYVFHGSEIREPQTRVHLDSVMKSQKQVVVVTPDLLEFAPNGRWIPFPQDLATFRPSKSNKVPSPLRILYYPRREVGPEIQGTPEVEAALTKLKNEGFKFEVYKLENVPYSDLPQLISTVDLVIDKVSRRMGWYGAFGLEALALNKPVMTYIREDLRHFMPFSPFVETTPDTVYNDLKAVLENPEMLNLPSNRRGREYVIGLHDEEKVAHEYKKIYEALISGDPEWGWSGSES